MNIVKTSDMDLELLMDSRIEMLKVVNNLPNDYVFDEKFVDCMRLFFLEGNQTTVLAMDGDKFAGCATICYIDVMPTFSHPTGRRAHLMNVYTRKEYRRKGVAALMVKELIEEARRRGVTEISLDATDAGRPLYETLGFVESKEAMNIIL